MAQLIPVRGTHDLLPDEFRKHAFIIETARNIALRYGFEELATPIFEYSEVFSRTLGEASDIVSKEMYTFTDRNNEQITLRPEGTAGVARAFLSEGLTQHLPLKLMYQGPMFRYERPQKGRQRQFHQIGIEILGVESTQADVEAISMAHCFLQALDLKGQVKLQINSIGDPESRNNYRAALVDYLKDKVNSLSQDSQRRLNLNPLRILDSKEEKDRQIVAGAPKLSDFLNEKSKATFQDICDFLEKLNIPFEINPLLVRGLDYYRHCVFEFVSDHLGAQNTVLAGGRYDGLIEMMGGPHTPGVGWAAGIERLALLLNKEIARPRPIALIPVGEDAERELVKIAHDLRQSGLLIEMAFGGNLSKRIKKANKVNAKVAVIIGPDELKKGEATVKNLDTGAQVIMKLNQLESRLPTFA